MKEIYFNSIQQVNDYYGVTTLHPLVSIIHIDRREHAEVNKCKFHYGVYALWLKETKGCTFSYGRTPYDFDEETVTSFEPGQTVNMEITDKSISPKCIGLFFHPDFLQRTHLGRTISRYEFFSYSSTEALHLSQQEIVVFKQVLDMIETELRHSIDTHTHELVVSNIELLLNYCLRFYDRQFITRQEINHSVVQKFDALLRDYIRNDIGTKGLPSVAYFADKCCLSLGYFGQLVKAETGKTAKDYINARLLNRAKEFLDDDRHSVTQISTLLGFEYPQHFVRFFKLHTGQTPSTYRKREAISPRN